jgi:pimeloyl-ACP methyl ester carboxylesterase
MIEALTLLEAFQTASEVVLIGYSGGGAIAALMAEKTNKLVMLITVAGNLDTDLWTSIQGYLPLDQSLNPLDHAVIPQSVDQFHLVGDKDSNIPPPIVINFSQRHNGKVIHFPEYNHHCCWVKAWPKILKDLTKPGA